MEGKISKVTLKKDEPGLRDDLKRYEEKALSMGASNVRIVNMSEIRVDERVPLKCRIPSCFGYGTSAHCPPHTLKPSELSDMLKHYKWALFFTKDILAEVIVRDKKTIEQRILAYQEVYNIVGELESMAFYDGHYLAFGLGAGSCRHTFCAKEKSCRALEGKRCRFSLKARPSMEAVGIDVYRMTAEAGWDIYPIGSGAKPENVVKGTLAGLVVIN